MGCYEGRLLTARYIHALDEFASQVASLKLLAGTGRHDDFRTLHCNVAEVRARCFHVRGLWDTHRRACVRCAGFANFPA